MFKRIITTIDSHTEGNGTRVVTSGLPPILGRTMAEKHAYAEKQLLWIPGFLLSEPRGHQNLYGAILVPPCSQEAQMGVLFMNNLFYETMCGHATLGVVTTLLETGMINKDEPETRITLDTPAGLVHTYARINDGILNSVSFESVPSFVYQSDAQIEIQDIGNIRIDIAFGGLFTTLVNVNQLSIELAPKNAKELTELGMRILRAVNKKFVIQHPELPFVTKTTDIRFYIDIGVHGKESKNVVIYGDHVLDRSPCGTGTSAEMALRYSKGLLGLGESFVTEGIIGTRFIGQVLREAEVGKDPKPYPAVVSRITGNAYLTGFHQFVLESDDPFPTGFRL